MVCTEAFTTAKRLCIAVTAAPVHAATLAAARLSLALVFQHSVWIVVNAEALTTAKRLCSRMALAGVHIAAMPRPRAADSVALAEDLLQRDVSTKL